MYQIREVTLTNELHEKKRLVIECDDPKMAIVGEFLMADSQLIGSVVLKEIEKILADEVDHIESNGNRCSLEIRKDKTLISDLFEGMFDGFDTYPSCEINTKELKGLILMWHEKLAQFNKRRLSDE